jgi:FKBP-type peptidyl-prolyl cis-trans isomerase
MAETQPPPLNDGLRVETDGLGSGESAKNGMTLHIEYKGAITNGYIVFDEGTR